MANKIFYVASIHKGRKSIYAGTLEALRDGVFGYTLECGNSWNHKIPRYPKTGKSLIKALNDSAYECNKYDDFYDLVTKEDFENHDGYKSMIETMA